jgi:UDPglucose 6-dehydrogenase
VKVYDPIAMDACRQLHPDMKLRYCESIDDLAREADALVVMTEWRQFFELDLAKLAAVMARPILVDGRNIFRPEHAVAAGFDYTGVGRCMQPRNGSQSLVHQETGAGTTT